MINREVRQLRDRYQERGQGHLFHNLMLFSRILREMGLDANPTRTIDLLRSLEHIGLERKEDFYHAGKAIMLRRTEEEAIYDYVFQVFWRRWPTPEDNTPLQEMPPEYWGDQKPSQNESPPPEAERGEADDQNKNEIESGKASRQLAEDTDSSEADPNSSEIDRQQTFSAGETLKEKDFQNFSQDELAEARRLMEQLRWKLSLRPTRRQVPQKHGRHLDGRRTVRKSLRYGGVPIELAHKDRKYKPRQLVLICDISGSMDLYSRLLLQFMHSLENGLRKVETFVFGTRLTRVTHELKDRNIDDALFKVSRTVKDWSGGTKIGESLSTFNHHWARRVLGHGAVVIIISDGWDRGDVDVLRQEMARLQRMSFRLIWLNPLLGLPDYQPLTIGIQAALDYVDDFLPAHNFRSLENLGLLLQSLSEHDRPARKQVASFSNQPPTQGRQW